MQDMVTVIIDGAEVSVPKGTTILDAATSAGIHIPNLCHIKGLKGIGACRLCLVEIEGLKAPMTACTTKVTKDGMKIKTVTPEIQEIRKFVIDLLVSMHPLDCMTCTKAGACNLQQYAFELGLKESSFSRKALSFDKDTKNPFIKRDPDYCVLCGRCVRICKSQGTNVLTFIDRGVGSRVSTAQDKPLQDSGCTFCGSCIDVCPVNAIVEADSIKHGRQWELKATDSICTLCGCACAMTVRSKADTIVRVNSKEDEDVLERYICAYGRFAFESLYSDSRLKSPLLNSEQTSWDEATTTVAELIKSDPAKTAIVFSASMLNEDISAIKAFAKSANISSLFSSTVLTGYQLPSEDALKKADTIIVVNISPNQRDRFLSAMDAYVMKKFSAGTKLISINVSTEGINRVASAVLQGNAKEILETVFSGSNSTDEQILIAQKTLAEATSTVIITDETSYASIYNACSNKATVICLPYEANAIGVALSNKASGCFDTEMLNGFETLIIAGYIAVAEGLNVKNLIVMSPFANDLTAKAKVALPATANLETSGSLIDFLGRTRTLYQVCKPYAQAKPYREIFASIAGKLGIKESTVATAKYKMDTKAKPTETPCKFDNLQQQNIMLKRVSPLINASRLAWLHELPQAKS